MMSLYCSREYCANAIKNAIEIKKPALTLRYVFHKDIRTYGFREELYMRLAVWASSSVSRIAPAVSRRRCPKAGRYRYHPGRDIAIRPDMAVLSTGIRPMLTTKSSRCSRCL